MAKGNKVIEYGMKSGLIGQSNNENMSTKQAFFDAMEAEYPSSEGWEVYATEVTPLEQNFMGAKVFLPYTTYHLRKLNK